MKKLNHSSCILFVLFFSSWKRTKVINLWQTCFYQVCFYRYQVKKPLHIPQTENHLLPPRDTEIIAHISPILYQKISLSRNVQHKDSNICNASRTNRKDRWAGISTNSKTTKKKNLSGKMLVVSIQKNVLLSRACSWYCKLNIPDCDVLGSPAIPQIHLKFSKRKREFLLCTFSACPDRLLREAYCCNRCLRWRRKGITFPACL